LTTYATIHTAPSKYADYLWLSSQKMSTTKTAEVVEKQGRELGHLHGHGLLDVSVGRQAASVLLAGDRVRPHHVFPCSKWVSFQIESQADLPFALELLTMAQSRYP